MNKKKMIYSFIAIITIIILLIAVLTIKYYINTTPNYNKNTNSNYIPSASPTPQVNNREAILTEYVNMKLEGYNYSEEEKFILSEGSDYTITSFDNDNDTLIIKTTDTYFIFKYVSDTEIINSGKIDNQSIFNDLGTDFTIEDVDLGITAITTREKFIFYRLTKRFGIFTALISPTSGDINKYTYTNPETKQYILNGENVTESDIDYATEGTRYTEFDWITLDNSDIAVSTPLEETITIEPINDASSDTASNDIIDEGSDVSDWKTTYTNFTKYGPSTLEDFASIYNLDYNANKNTYNNLEYTNINLDGYYLLDVDNDDVPELFVNFIGETTNQSYISLLFKYDNGQVIYVGDFTSIQSISYTQNEHNLLVSYLSYGVCTPHEQCIYTIVDNELTTLHYYYAEPIDLENYKYTIDEVEVTEDEFYKYDDLVEKSNEIQFVDLETLLNWIYRLKSALFSVIRCTPIRHNSAVVSG